MDEFSNIWIEQCDAARGIRNDWGTRKALGYLVGEKLLVGGIWTIGAKAGLGFLVLTLRVLRAPSAVEETRRQPAPAVAVPH